MPVPSWEGKRAQRFNFPRNVKSSSRLEAARPAIRRVLKRERPSQRQPPAARQAEVPSELPVYKAFVLQFTRATRTRGGVFSGRVEHMSSGRRAGFTSRNELLAVLERMIDQLGEDET